MKVNEFYGKLNKVNMDSKAERLYNILKQLDVVKNVKEKNISNHKDWNYLIDLLFDGVYND
tara:strand:+ start:944 stop:1126 length:183 start_codon:yes stop_codon:yes gene_type:complete